MKPLLPTSQVLFPPTPDGEPAFVTVSGDKGIYAWPFDLPQGDWTVSTKIENNDPDSEEILVVSFFSGISKYLLEANLCQNANKPVPSKLIFLASREFGKCSKMSL